MNPPPDQAGVYRLPPTKDPLSPQEIADVFGLQTPEVVKQAIRDGRLKASFIGGRYYIFRAEAVDFLHNCVVTPEEAPKT